MFRSCSRAYWLLKLPAAARVVANAQKRIEGGGVRAERWEGQVVVSISVIPWLIGVVVVVVVGGWGGERREMMLMLVIVEEGLERRVERMWEPCSGGVG
jgi:hypothetical protein